jgi:hypothetical protein
MDGVAERYERYAASAREARKLQMDERERVRHGGSASAPD